MARSRKRTPKAGISTAVSEKGDKQANHRRERRRIHQALTIDAEADIFPRTKELSNPWAMAKDGKIFLGKHSSRKALRK